MPPEHVAKRLVRRVPRAEAQVVGREGDAAWMVGQRRRRVGERGLEDVHEIRPADGPVAVGLEPDERRPDGLLVQLAHLGEPQRGLGEALRVRVETREPRERRLRGRGQAEAAAGDLVEGARIALFELCDHLRQVARKPLTHGRVVVPPDEEHGDGSSADRPLRRRDRRGLELRPERPEPRLEIRVGRRAGRVRGAPVEERADVFREGQAHQVVHRDLHGPYAVKDDGSEPVRRGPHHLLAELGSVGGAEDVVACKTQRLRQGPDVLRVLQGIDGGDVGAVRRDLGNAGADRLAAEFSEVALARDGLLQRPGIRDGGVAAGVGTGRGIDPALIEGDDVAARPDFVEKTRDQDRIANDPAAGTAMEIHNRVRRRRQGPGLEDHEGQVDPPPVGLGVVLRQVDGPADDGATLDLVGRQRPRARRRRDGIARVRPTRGDHREDRFGRLRSGEREDDGDDLVG